MEPHWQVRLTAWLGQVALRYGLIAGLIHAGLVTVLTLIVIYNPGGMLDSLAGGGWLFYACISGFTSILFEGIFYFLVGLLAATKTARAVTGLQASIWSAVSSMLFILMMYLILFLCGVKSQDREIFMGICTFIVFTFPFAICLGILGGTIGRNDAVKHAHAMYRDDLHP